MSPFALIVFDLDGTLVDSRRDLAESVNAMLDVYGHPRLDEDLVGRMVGDGAPTLVARAFAAHDLERPPDALERFLSIYNGRLLKHTQPYPGMRQVLDRLEPDYPLAVLTNKPIAATREILQGLDLQRYFAEAAVLGGDCAFPRKPDPSGLLHLCRQAGAPPEETLLVGDSIVDWRTARHAASCICLARYGFGFEAFPVSELGADERVIDAPLQLLDL